MKLLKLSILAWGGMLGGLGCGHAPTEPKMAATDLPPAIAVVDTQSTTSDDVQKQKLVAAYPDYVRSYEGNYILTHDGRKFVWDDGKRDKSFAELESNPDLEDMFTYPYPAGEAIFRENYDPGRIRNEDFFKHMYGATADQVGVNLVQVKWISGEADVKITRTNGVDKALEAVVVELAALPALRKYLVSPGGTFNWRTIAGTDRLSAHSFGMAVDINTSFADYWRWSAEFKAGKPLVYHNRIPLEIVRIFERHGFIWGGKWYHYDTMHFEYRPELL